MTGGKVIDICKYNNKIANNLTNTLKLGPSCFIKCVFAGWTGS